MSPGPQLQPVILVILDGVGLRAAKKDNALALADTQTLDRLLKTCPWLRLDPSGTAVGLPARQMGTSEVGHLNLGAGRVVDQDLVRINKAIKDGSFFTNSALGAAMGDAKEPGAALHLVGLCSDGGVHSHLDHLFALLEMAAKEELEHVFIHAITDGRDTPPRVATRFIEAIKRKCARLGVGEIATVTGRFYAMDRDNRWERERRAYDALVHDDGLRYGSAVEAVEAAHKRGEGDEFIQPSVIATKDHRTGHIIDGDSVIFFNFRQDRARQLTHGFTDEHFDKFARARLRIRFTTMTSYDKALDLPVAFPPFTVRNGLAEWLSKRRVKQCHAAETEKYAHVTYFFNGGRERPFRGEERVLVPSPRIATYDKRPGMSADGVKDAVLKALRSGLYGFVIVNFANCDMVGHTGDFDATVEAVEAVDRCLSELETEAETRGWVMLVTSDHGNAEEMSGEHETSHTLNNVPFVVVDPQRRYGVFKLPKPGMLADVAPTVLDIMGLPRAPGMTGKVLVRRKAERLPVENAPKKGAAKKATKKAAKKATGKKVTKRKTTKKNAARKTAKKNVVKRPMKKAAKRTPAKKQGKNKKRFIISLF